MNRQHLPVFVASLLLAATAHGDVEPQLNSSADTVSVEIAPRPGRRSVALPGLDVPFRINAHCADGTLATSVSISIADTVVSHDVTAKSDNTNGQRISPVLLETIFKVPGRQIAPIATKDFCAGEPDSQANEEVLLVRDAFAANISLRCSSDTSQSIRYERLPLEIQLICRIPDEKPIDSP